MQQNIVRCDQYYGIVLTWTGPQPVSYACKD
jgi:hypothetical protein